MKSHMGARKGPGKEEKMCVYVCDGEPRPWTDGAKQHTGSNTPACVQMYQASPREIHTHQARKSTSKQDDQGQKTSERALIHSNRDVHVM